MLGAVLPEPPAVQQRDGPGSRPSECVIGVCHSVAVAPLLTDKPAVAVIGERRGVLAVVTAHGDAVVCVVAILDDVVAGILCPPYPAQVVVRRGDTARARVGEEGAQSCSAVCHGGGDIPGCGDEGGLPVAVVGV